MNLEGKFSNSSVDRLGLRIKSGQFTDQDLRELDNWRRSFAQAYDEVIGAVRALELEPTGRPAKSTSSIVAKLNRESIRLSQMQDIAGCRLVVGDRPRQDLVVGQLRKAFPNAIVHDRRLVPSHGYRAVHLVVSVVPEPVEVQVRTDLQHMWGELSEKLSDLLGAEIKYGVGNQVALDVLAESSSLIATFEELEGDDTPARILELRHRLVSSLREVLQSMSEIRGA